MRGARRSRCGFVVCLLVFAAALSGARTRPNLLLIVADDLHWRSVGVFGSAIPDATPHIDRLAREGMRFERAHVTVSVCQPSRAVWMTGRYPHRNGALGFQAIRPEVPTLVEQLHAAGYRTGILGKLDHVVPTRIAAWDQAVSSESLGSGRNPANYYARTVDFVSRAREANQPFFLMANLGDAHRPFPGAEERAPTDYPAPTRSFRPFEIEVPGFLPDLPAVRRDLARYQAAVTRADTVVGSVVGALRDSGLASNTLVMFLSDNGMSMPFAKANCFDHSTRTPWIVRWPGVVTPGRSDAKHFVSGIDLAPTLLDAAGIPPLAGSDGISFLPILRGEGQLGRKHVFTQIDGLKNGRFFPMRAVRGARFGYVFNAWSDGSTVYRNAAMHAPAMEAMRAVRSLNPTVRARLHHLHQRVPEELYDYRKDPDALRNLVGDPRYVRELAELRKRLLAQMERTEDPQLVPFRKHLGLAP